MSHFSEYTLEMVVMELFEQFLLLLFCFSGV